MYTVPMLHNLNLPQKQKQTLAEPLVVTIDMDTYRLSYLNKLAGKLSLYVLLGNIKVKPMSVVKRDFQIWKLKIFSILVCKAVYSCIY